MRTEARIRTDRKYRKSPRGRAVKAWRNILGRAGNADGQHSSYAGIELKMTRSEFLEWAVPRYAEWIAKGIEGVPSVDRIQSSGHYELGNLQLIERRLNSSKRKCNLTNGLPEGLKKCAHCNEVKPFEAFGFRSQGLLKKRYICILCERKESANRWRKKKGEIN